MEIQNQKETQRGGKREGAGRPKGSTRGGTKRVSFIVSCTPEIRDKIKQLASEQNKTISQLIIEKVLEN